MAAYNALDNHIATTHLRAKHVATSHYLASHTVIVGLQAINLKINASYHCSLTGKCISYRRQLYYPSL